MWVRTLQVVSAGIESLYVSDEAGEFFLEGRLSEMKETEERITSCTYVTYVCMFKCLIM